MEAVWFASCMWLSGAVSDTDAVRIMSARAAKAARESNRVEVRYHVRDQAISAGDGAEHLLLAHKPERGLALRGRGKDLRQRVELPHEALRQLSPARRCHSPRCG